MTSEERKELSELIYVCRKLREKNLVNATHGNISVRLGDLMYITPTGCDLESVSEEDLVAVDIKTACVRSAGKPSKEWEMHLPEMLFANNAITIRKKDSSHTFHVEKIASNEQ